MSHSFLSDDVFHQGHNLRRVREFCMLSQKGLAMMLHTNQQKISRLEKSSRLDQKILLKLSVILNVEPSVLICFEYKPSAKSIDLSRQIALLKAYCISLKKDLSKLENQIDSLSLDRLNLIEEEESMSADSLKDRQYAYLPCSLIAI